MKKILFIFILSLAVIFGKGQERTVKEFKYVDNNYMNYNLKITFVNSDVVFSEIYQLDSTLSKDIYSKAKMAIVDVFRSAKDVTQLDDSENKILIVKGSTSWLKDKDPVLFTKGFNVHFTLKIECKDNKYRVSLYGLYSKNSVSTAYGTVTIIANPSDCLKQGVKKDGSIRNNIYGLSWLAWSEISYETFNELHKYIASATLNTSEDW